MGLGIATVLTISFMQGALNDNVPRVSYLKSIDYFLLGSFVFVFMTLIEYVLVLKHSRKKKRRKKELEIKTLERERKRQEALMITEDEDEKVGCVTICAVKKASVAYVPSIFLDFLFVKLKKIIRREKIKPSIATVSNFLVPWIAQFFYL